MLDVPVGSPVVLHDQAGADGGRAAGRVGEGAVVGLPVLLMGGDTRLGCLIVRDSRLEGCDSLILLDSASWRARASNAEQAPSSLRGSFRQGGEAQGTVKGVKDIGYGAKLYRPHAQGRRGVSSAARRRPGIEQPRG